MSLSSTWSSESSRFTVAKAIVPDGSIWRDPPSSYGLNTVTPSIVPTSPKNSVIAACTAGSATPCSARNTIEPDCRLAPCCGKNSDITSNPEALSDAGISNALENDGPTITFPNAPKPTRATSHAISVVRRR